MSNITQIKSWLIDKVKKLYKENITVKEKNSDAFPGEKYPMRSHFWCDEATEQLFK